MITQWRPIPRGRRTKDAPRRTSTPRAYGTHARARTAYEDVHENAVRAEKFTQNRHKITHVWPADPSGSGELGSHWHARARRQACERSACVGALAASVRQPSRARRSLPGCADAAPPSEAPRAGAQRRAALRAGRRGYVGAAPYRSRGRVADLRCHSLGAPEFGPWGRAPTKFNASFAVGASWVLSERVQNAEWRVESERLASFFARVSRRPRARRHSVAPRARRGARRAARGRGRAGGARGGGDGRPAQGRPRARARARALGWALWLG